VKISVIIPTLNAERYLPELLGRLKSQTLKPDEIIVVDSSSNDRSVMVAEQFGARTLIVERHTFDHGGTRNYAASHAKGDILVYLTQDALPSGDAFLENLTSPFQNVQVAAAFGRQIAGPTADPIERMTREFNYPPTSTRKSKESLKEYGIKTFFFTNVCSAIRKNAFLSVEGFPQPVIMSEDMIFAARCILKGYSIQYVSEAQVIHSHQYTLIQQFRRHFDIGAALSMNDWLLQYASPQGEGAKLVKKQLEELLENRLWSWLPRWFAENLTKSLGYFMGLHYRKLPNAIRIAFSMHSYYWKRGSRSHSVVIQPSIEKSYSIKK